MTTAKPTSPAPQWNDFSACLERLKECLVDLVGAAPQPGAFGTVTVHITPATGDNAMSVERWVYDAQVLLACLHAIEPAAQMRINVTGLGAMHHMALHGVGVVAGRFVNVVDYAPALALIPEALRPCTRTGLPVRHAVLAEPQGLS
ncbi:hypothetical protein DZC30_05070 [Comamonas testosteroni]|uniref:Uncharacterized protein n=1 Tax=Comamonas testosteroni TaxID=285 RepID=A0A373FRL1_COMTE|nr:hypothetical protein [Comamonas testosteroni]RGE46142.1 hypothetical protein DZC30_05070 [Comamonas testosteroni]